MKSVILLSLIVGVLSTIVEERNYTVDSTGYGGDGKKIQSVVCAGDVKFCCDFYAAPITTTKFSLNPEDNQVVGCNTVDSCLQRVGNSKDCRCNIYTFTGLEEKEQLIPSCNEPFGACVTKSSDDPFETKEDATILGQCQFSASTTEQILYWLPGVLLLCCCIGCFAFIVKKSNDRNRMPQQPIIQQQQPLGVNKVDAFAQPISVVPATIAPTSQIATSNVETVSAVTFVQGNENDDGEESDGEYVAVSIPIND